MKDIKEQIESIYDLILFSIEIAVKKDLAGKFAKITKEYYSALIMVGFSEKDALEIVKAHAIHDSISKIGGGK